MMALSGEPENEVRTQALVLEVLAAAGGRLRVNGSSMAPSLRPGDYVVFAPAAIDSLRPGDLLVVRRPADLVTHRLLWINARGVYTKGDAAWQADPPVPPGDILGRVTAVERGGRRWDFSTRRWQALNRLLGWAGRLPAGLIHYFKQN